MSFREKLDKARERYNNPMYVANDNLPEEGVNSDYFGIGNISNPPPSIDLRLADGKRVIMPYPFIKVNYNSDEGIEILTAFETIKITGRNLDKLVDYLAAFRVRYIKTHSGTDSAEDGALFVEIILINQV